MADISKIKTLDGTTYNLKDSTAIISVEISSLSSLPITITSDFITEKHYLLESTLSNPSAQTGDWTVTTTDGSMTISGSISGTTAVHIMLGRADNYIRSFS